VNRILFFGIIVGASLLWFIASRIDISLIHAELARADLYDLLLAVCALASAFAVKALRWALLMPQPRSFRWHHLLYPVIVGNAGNAIVPHSGELLRTALVNRKWNVQYTTSLTSIAMERMFDFLSVGAVSLSIFFNGELSGPLATALRFIAAGFAVLLLVFFALIARPAVCAQMLNWLTKPFPIRLADIVDQEFQTVMNTLQALRRGHLLIRITALSLLQWLLIGTSIYLCIQAVGVNTPFAVAAAVLILTVAGLTLPTAPGYVGTIQVCFLIGMSGFSTEDQAIAASVLYNFVVTVPVIIPALPAFVNLNLWRRRRN
jgi:uncharacterized protein (TIRG00374 family)